MQPLPRVKSHLSFGFGTASVPALVARAAELKLPALALTDEENLCGQIAFHHLCRARGIHPVTGVELAGRVVLLARDRDGWSSLCRIVTARRAGGDEDVDALISRHARGLEVVPFEDAATLLHADDEPLHRLLAERSKRAPAPKLLAPSEATAGGFTLDLTEPLRVLPDVRPPLEELRARAVAKGPGYPERLEQELAVFARMGLERYLGLVAEVCAHARAKGIALAVRGSGASSLAVHLLGASPVDPLKHGLLFERFLHERRTALPDVDLDVDSERRHELIEFVHRRFGKERTAMVCSFVTWQDASALEVTNDPELRKRLVGTPRHLAVHPGGIVVADRPLEELVPLERTTRGVVVTQLDLRSIQEAGLVKLDLLGNRALTQLDLASHGDAVPEDDARTLDALARADTIGCFQVETPPVRAQLLKQGIRSLDDVTLALALVRPGPASSGELAFEEDLIRRIAALKGISLGEADALREQLVAGAKVDLGDPNLERLAAYTFSKAHAASYARLAYECVYWMQHRPLHFGAALLDHYGGHYPLRTIAWELQRKGVRLLPPDVNRAEEACTVEGDAVRLGLQRVKRLTARSRKALREGRPFRHLAEVEERVGLRELEALVLCGACDELLGAEPFPFPHRRVLHEAGSVLRMELLDRWPALVRTHVELNHLELSWSGHPMHLLREAAEKEGCLPLAQLRGASGRVRFAGTLAASRPVETSKGATMQFLTVEDETGLVETVLFPPARAALFPRLTTPGPYLFSGEVKEDGTVDVRWLLPFFQRGR